MKAKCKCCGGELEWVEFDIGSRYDHVNTDDFVRCVELKLKEAIK